MPLRPVELRLRHEPEGDGVYGRVVHPRAVLEGGELVPPEFRLRILEGSLGEVAHATPEGKGLYGGGLGIKKPPAGSLLSLPVSSLLGVSFHHLLGAYGSKTHLSNKIHQKN